MNSTRWPRRCGRGTTSAPAWPARPGRRSGWPRPRPTTPRRRRARRGGWSSCCSRRRTRACWSPPSRPGTTTAACAGGWTDRRSCCWPSWAGPAGSIPELAPGLRTARPSELDPRRRRRLPVPVGHGRGARRGRVRRAAAVLVGPAPQAGARAVRAHPGRRSGEQGRQVRSRPARRLPLGAGGRRRHAHRGRDRGACRDQGPADPAARPVGGAGPRSAAPRAGVPGAQASRPQDRGRDPRAGRQPP